MIIEITIESVNHIKLNSQILKFQPDVEGEEAQDIYLEGKLPHESKILVSDAETTTERFVKKRGEEEDAESGDLEPAVVLSSKMTLSLISLDPQDRVEAVHESTSTNTDNDKGNSSCHSIFII